MEYSDQVVKVLSECVATAMKKAMSDTSRAIEEKLRNYKFSGDNIKQMSIGNTHILPQSIDNIHIKDASIDVAKVKDFMAEVANIAVANIKSATIDTAQIRDLAAYTANIANANIKNATIKYAQIEGLTAGSALIQEAVGNKVMIADLAVVEANMVNLTLGSLVLKGEDGCFYSILVGEDGQVKTELKQIVNDDIKNLSLNAGEKLIEGSITAGCLNVEEIFANKALIGAIRTVNLDAAEITANKAFIEKLATSLIESPDDTGLKLASQNFVTLHVPGELKNNSVTVDKNGVEITGGKIIMDASTAIDILSGGALNVNGGTLSLQSSATMNIVSGALNVQSGSSVNIRTGGAFTIDSGNFSVSSSGSVSVRGTIYASAGEIGGLTIEKTTLSDLSSTANAAKTSIGNVTNGTTAVPYVKTTAITISGNNLTIGANGKLELQSNSGIDIKTGGTFTIGSGNFKIDSSGNVTVKGTVNASAGVIGGLKIESSTLSDLSSTASTAKSTADTATTNIGKITNGTTAVPYVKSTAITISGNNMTVGANGKLTLQSNSGLTINTGGTLTIGSGNFSIDASGNVTMTGKVTASSGKIGGWNISTDRLYAGSGTSYVALNTNASYPAIWAGNGTYSDAPFRVYQDGAVYITSLYALKEDGTQEKVDLRSSYWKMDSAYSHAVKTLSVADDVLTIALYNGTTVNFKKADLSGVSVGAGGGFVYVKDKNGKTVSGTNKNITTGGDNIVLSNFSADTKKADVYFDLIMDGSVFKRSWVNTDVSSVYNAGYSAVTVSMSAGTPSYGQTSIDITATAKLSNGRTKDLPIGINVGKYVPSYIKRTAYSTDNKTVTVEASNSASVQTTYSKDISASEIYDAGYEAGQKSMGVEVNGNTVSVVVSDTKSVTARLSDNHRVGYDSRVTLTPGTMFTGTAGAYYLNAKLLGSSSISWS